MRIAPVSLNQQKSQSFGTLHFELDKPSKQLYYDMCKEQGYSESWTLECIGGLNKIIADMDEKTDKQVQWFLNQSPATRYLLAKDVWPEKTVVPLSVRRVQADENNQDLVATIDGRYSVTAEDIEDMKPYTPQRRYNDMDYRAFLYRLPKVDFIIDELIIPQVLEKPLYVKAANEFAERADMDDETKVKDIRKDINEWLG
ncbi:MAG: hypothetical protein NC191_02555 [Muribaculaceae bacterium]|nr:hypothetical protein [Muribaculaceae bacterium]